MTAVDASVSISPLLQALNGRMGPTPVWLMRQAGRYLPEYREVRARAGGFFDLCYNPGLACEVALQPIRRFGLDAAILFSDILVIPDALGQGVRFDEGVGPVLSPLSDGRALAALDADGVERRLAPVFETLERMRGALPPETAVIGFSGAPWTIAVYMLEGRASREFLIAKSWVYGRREEFSRLIALLEEAISRYLIRQVESGAQMLQLFDTWAMVLDDAAFVEWVEKPTARIVARVKARFPRVPVVAFPRGAGASLEGFARRTGVDGISIDTRTPLAWARDRLRPETAVQGNLDPCILRIGGPAMRRAAAAIMAALSGRGRFVFNLGHGILPDTPPDHVAELVRLVRELDTTTERS